MTTRVSSSTLANTAVTTGTYGGTTQNSVVTVDQQGRVTFASNVTPSIANTQITGTITGAQLSAGAANTNLGFVPVGPTLTSSQVTTALGFTPYNSTNPSGYVTSSTAPVTSVNGSTGAVSISALGVSQTLQDLSSSRSLNTTYTNSTGKPIVFYVSMGYGDADLLVNGINFGHSPATGAANCVVPAGATYQANAAGGRYFNYWYEYR
jgi:hypothetical protein